MASAPPCLVGFGSFFRLLPLHPLSDSSQIRPRLLQPIRNRTPVRLGFVVLRNFSPPSMVIQDFSPPQVRHIEVMQPKRTRELPQLVQTKRLGEDIDILPIRQNILKFDFTREDMLKGKMIVHLNVLSLEYGVLRKLDAIEVVIVYRRRIGHLHL